MKYFFDTEFIEDGKTIEAISIGIINDNGDTFYAEWNDFDYYKTNDFVLEHVIPNLRMWNIDDLTPFISKDGPNIKMYGNREFIKSELLKWIGKDKPKFYAWYASYDWVMLCQIFGTMMDLPDNWPMFVYDVKPLFDQLEYTNSWKKANHPDPSDVHNALADAIWLKDMYNDL